MADDDVQDLASLLADRVEEPQEVAAELLEDTEALKDKTTPLDEEPPEEVDDQAFPVNSQPAIQLAKTSKGYWWMLISSDGRRLAMSPEAYPKLRDLRADIGVIQAQLPLANIQKLY